MKTSPRLFLVSTAASTVFHVALLASLWVVRASEPSPSVPAFRAGEAGELAVRVVVRSKGRAADGSGVETNEEAPREPDPPRIADPAETTPAIVAPRLAEPVNPPSFVLLEDIIRDLGPLEAPRKIHAPVQAAEPPPRPPVAPERDVSRRTTENDEAASLVTRDRAASAALARTEPPELAETVVSAPSDAPPLAPTRPSAKTSARLASELSPRYPRSCRRRGHAGTALLRCEVDAAGRVRAVRIVSSAGCRRLDQSALDAVRAARFRPGRVGETMTASTVTLPVEFRLR